MIEKNRRKGFDYYIFLLFLLFVLLSGYSSIFLGCYWTIAGLLTKKGLVDLTGMPAGHDFVVFWTASKMARSGDPSSIYSVQKLQTSIISFIGTDVGRWAWNYPPTFLLIVLPLSFFPYVVSLMVWVIGALYAYLFVIGRIISHPIAPWIFLGFPPVVYNLFAGQNGLFSTLLLGGGLLLLDRNPLLGGFLLGILSYKPHLFALVPLALLAGRHWRALGGLVVGVNALTITSLIVFGSRTWESFFYNIHFATTHWQTEYFLVRMPTIFAAARSAGASVSMAAIFQSTVTLIVVCLVIWVWFKGFPLPLKGAILSLCIPLSTPYLFPYDLPLIGLAFAWLGWMVYSRGERRGFAFLIICWISLHFSIFADLNLKVTPIVLIVLLLFAIRFTTKNIIANAN